LGNKFVDLFVDCSDELNYHDNQTTNGSDN